MKDEEQPNFATNADHTNSPQWEWVERDFDQLEVADQSFVGWMMQYVRMSPFTQKLFLSEGEVVRTTPDMGGGMKIEIRFENSEDKHLNHEIIL